MKIFIKSNIFLLTFHKKFYKIPTWGEINFSIGLISLMNQAGFNIVFLSFDHETLDLFRETTLFKTVEYSLERAKL
jgi:hypothetical protein